MSDPSAPRQAAVLFADVAGSTKLYESLGDAEALETITRVLDVMRQVCEDHGGRIVKTIGDEAMVVFPSAANATYAAIAMQTQIAALRTSRGAPIAIHAGLPLRAGDRRQQGRVRRLGQPRRAPDRARQRRPDAGLGRGHGRDAFAVARSRTRSQDTHTVRGKQNDIAVFELIWQESREDLTAMAPRAVGCVARAHADARRDGGRPRPEVNVFTFGRDAANDMVIADKMASRQHARIERRRDKFVLIDHSTNGTYCTIEGEQRDRAAPRGVHAPRAREDRVRPPPPRGSGRDGRLRRPGLNRARRPTWTRRPPRSSPPGPVPGTAR